MRVDQNRLGPWHHIAPETSRQAAVHNYPRNGTQRAAVLLAIHDHDGLTDQEASRILHLEENCIRPRRNELLGRTKPPSIPLVRDSGWRRPTRSGEDAAVWVCTDAGQAAVRQLRGDNVIPFPDVNAAKPEPDTTGPTSHPRKRIVKRTAARQLPVEDVPVPVQRRLVRRREGHPGRL